MNKPTVDKKRIAELIQKKLDTSVKIREFRLEMAKLNQELFRAGVGISDIAAW